MAEISARCGVEILVLAGTSDSFTTQKSWEGQQLGFKVIYAYKYGWRSILLPFKLLPIRKKGEVLIFSFYHGIFGRSAITNFLTTMLFLIMSKVCRFKVFTIMHTLPEARRAVTGLFPKNLSYLYYLGLRITTSLILRLSYRVIVLVKVFREILSISKSGYNKINYLPHGAPIYIMPKPKKLSAKKKEVNIAFIGLVSPRKNINILSEALCIVKRSLNIKKIRMILIGTPHPYIGELRNLNLSICKDIEIKYLGYLNTASLQKYLYNHVNLVILPYVFPTGTSGIAWIIAPSATPVVLPFFIEYYELYKQGMGLKFYNPKSTDLASTIASVSLNILKNQEVYEALSERQCNVSIKYNMKKIALSLLRLILSSLNTIS
jgi:glycosyltransferase involved in cell wall biosynthesis